MAELQGVFHGQTHAKYTPNSYKETYGVVRNEEQEDEEKQRDEEAIAAARKRIEAKLQTSIFKHVSGSEPSAASKDKTWFDIKPSRMQMPLYRNLRVNKTWLAMNWNSSDTSAVCVFKMGTQGRVSARQPCIRAHRFLAGFDLSPFHENQLVTAGDGVLRFWTIPEEGLPKGGRNLEAADADFQLESLSKISFVQFHPYIPDVVIVGASDFDGNLVQFWDVRNKKAQIELSFEAEVLDVSISPNCSRALVCTKDGQAHLIDLHTKQTLRTFQPLESLKDTSSLWVDQKNNLVVIGGTTKGNQRSVSLYNAFTGESLGSHAVELGTSVGLDYEPSSQLLFVSAFGSTFVQVLRVHPKKQSGVDQLEYLNQFQSLEDVTGHMLLPKSVINVKEVEIARSVKLTRNKICLVNWTVPRKRLEFFQDDLFPPAYLEEPRMSAQEFFGGKFPEGNDAWESRTVDLQPAGMEKLSEAPEEELSDRQKKYHAFKQQQAAPKSVGVLGHKNSKEVRQYFLQAQNKYSTKNRWDAKLIDGNEVDDGEWDD